MAGARLVSWVNCDHDGCQGVRLRGGKCLAHSSRAQRRWTLRGLRKGRPLDMKGVAITPALLDEVLAAAPKDATGRLRLPEVDFTGATFQGKIQLTGATFQGDATFDGATFEGDATFDEATFQGHVRFWGATFQGWTDFRSATFQRQAELGEATFQRGTSFTRAAFKSWVLFSMSVFHGYASFHGATFQDHAGFDEATFKGGASFGRATFQGDAKFTRVTSQGEAWFYGATFDQARQLGPMLVRKQLVLTEAVFNQRVQIEASAATVCGQGARFPAGVQLRLRWAQIVLDDADLAAPSILTGVSAFPDLNEGRWARAVQRLQARDVHSGRPRLVSVRRADVAGLTISNVDLRACRFVGAHNLDKLRIEGIDLLGATPPRRSIYSWGWTTRYAIAEEHHWRYRHPTESRVRESRREGWYKPEHQPPAWLSTVEEPQPQQIAELYRALRKGREDSKDEPGAADFYFGEMDMRREAKHQQAKDARGKPSHDGARWVAAQTEHAILWLYWAVSGYALRGWRAFGVLLGVLLLATGLIAWVGFPPPRPATALTGPVSGTSPPPTVGPEPVRAPSMTTQQPVGARLGAAALVALEGAVFRTSDQQLTYRGRLIQTVVRFFGPVLLALALLSIRGRVKR